MKTTLEQRAKMRTLYKGEPWVIELLDDYDELAGRAAKLEVEEPVPTRPMTTKDRPDVKPGDVIRRASGCVMTVTDGLGVDKNPILYRAVDEDGAESAWITDDPHFVYVSRADGGPVTVPLEVKGE